MLVGAGIIKLRIHGAMSLKDKRRVVRPLIEKLKNSFNISVAEVGGHDLHGWAEIGFSLSGSDSGVIDSVINRVLEFTECYGEAEVAGSETDIMRF